MMPHGVMEKLLYIAIGGGVGSVLRYLLGGWTQRVAGGAAGGVAGTAVGAFPFGTLVVNALGCLAIGVLGALFAMHRVRDEWRLMLAVGLLGGFTTFSSFAFETLTLAEDGARGRALSNLLLTNALCLLAVWLGYRLTQRWYGI
jgi:fluoride exporter